MSQDRRRAEVVRVYERYVVEVVERYDLCPWARVARERAEVAVEVLWGTPSLDTWIATARAAHTREGISVAMVIAPELVITSSEFHDLRGEVSRAIPTAGVAEFHPDAALDLGSPARLVSYIRRSPDPLLQLVPLALLEGVRAKPPTVALLEQAQILGGLPVPQRRDAADKIAAMNHAVLSTAHVDVTRTLEDIAADRRRSYAAAGIATGSPAPGA